MPNCSRYSSPKEIRFFINNLKADFTLNFFDLSSSSLFILLSSLCQSIFLSFSFACDAFCIGLLLAGHALRFLAGKNFPVKAFASIYVYRIQPKQ